MALALLRTSPPLLCTAGSLSCSHDGVMGSTMPIQPALQRKQCLAPPPPSTDGGRGLRDSKHRRGPGVQQPQRDGCEATQNAAPLCRLNDNEPTPSSSHPHTAAQPEAFLAMPFPTGPKLAGCVYWGYDETGSNSGRGPSVKQFDSRQRRSPAPMGFEGIGRAYKYLYLYPDSWEVSVKVRLAICQSVLVCVGPPAHNHIVSLLQCSRRVLQVVSMPWLSIQGR